MGDEAADTTDFTVSPTVWAPATTAPRIPAPRLALHHFDTTYSLQLQELWPAVRSAMLCEQKYGALLNNFACADLTAQRLELLSATDFVSEAASCSTAPLSVLHVHISAHHVPSRALQAAHRA